MGKRKNGEAYSHALAAAEDLSMKNQGIGRLEAILEADFGNDLGEGIAFLTALSELDTPEAIVISEAQADVLLKNKKKKK